MDGSAIVLQNSSRMYWNDGNIDVVNPSANSSIAIGMGCEFVIQSSGTWGMTDAPTVGTYFAVGNYGKVHVKSGANATINGDYTTDNYTFVESGTITVTKRAVQTYGIFELKSGGTVKLTTKPLNIAEGSLVGTGTVDGNCTLGYDPNLGVPVPPSTTASISPGRSDSTNPDRIGTLTITAQFQMFGGTMWIDINKYGVFDTVVVQGAYAALSDGRLEVSNGPEFTPDTGVYFYFVTGNSVAGFKAENVNILNNYWILEDLTPENPYERFSGRYFRTKADTTGFGLEVFRLP